MSIKQTFNTPLEQLADIRLFARATWTALGFASVCLALDVYAILFLPHRRNALASELHAGEKSFPFVVWGMEIILALLAIWLIRFAFSRGPRVLPPQLPAARPR